MLRITQFDTYEDKFTCKICNSKSARLLYKKNACSILKCHDCHTVQTWTDKEVKYNYSKQYYEGGLADGYNSYLANEIIIKKEFKKTINTILKYSNNNYNKLIEIGCAYGYFLDLANEHFDSMGIEISEFGTEFCKKKGLNVRQGTLESLNETIQNDYDVAVCLDVIEHLEDPLKSLQILHSKLRADAILIITTGDINSILAVIMRKKWRLMTPPQHLFFFTKKTLESLLNKSGFDIIKMSRKWKLVPISLILFQLRRYVNFRLKLNYKHLNRGIPINLFDTMYVVAKKISLD